MIVVREGKSIEERRADVVRQLIEPGARRIHLIEQLADVEDEIYPLVIEAVRLGITTRRVGELVGLSSATVSNWATGKRRTK